MSNLPSVDYMIADACVNIMVMRCDSKQGVIDACRLFDEDADMQYILVGFVLAKYGKSGVAAINECQDDGMDTLEIISPFIDELWEEVTK